MYKFVKSFLVQRVFYILHDVDMEELLRRPNIIARNYLDGFTDEQFTFGGKKSD